MNPRATVILPTTAGRAPVLPFSVASVLRQSVTELELFVMGDGVTDVETRQLIEDLVASDDRVHFIDNPKHPRRGEPHRHDVLMERASGQFVAYLCDRDLWFRDHLEQLEALLEYADFAATAGALFGDSWPDVKMSTKNTLLAARRTRNERPLVSAPLSTTGHTLDAYRRLPRGWHETPSGRFTDSYMWDQFYDQPWLRIGYSPVPTAVWLFRSGDARRSIEARSADIEYWADLMATRESEFQLRQDVLLTDLERWHELEVDASRPSLWFRRGVELSRRAGVRRIDQLKARVRARSSASVPKPSDRSDTTDGSNGHSIPSSGSDQ